MIKMGLVTLLLDSGPKLAVGQWIALPGVSGSRGKLCILWGKLKPQTTCKDFNLAIAEGLDWMKWVKLGQGNVYILCNYSCTISFLVKILLVKLKYLYVQYAWISIMKNNIVTNMGRLKRWWYLSKLLAITITSFNFVSCPVKF